MQRIYSEWERRRLNKPPSWRGFCQIKVDKAICVWINLKEFLTSTSDAKQKSLPSSTAFYSPRLPLEPVYSASLSLSLSSTLPLYPSISAFLSFPGFYGSGYSAPVNQRTSVPPTQKTACLIKEVNIVSPLICESHLFFLPQRGHQQEWCSCVNTNTLVLACRRLFFKCSALFCTNTAASPSCFVKRNGNEEYGLKHNHKLGTIIDVELVDESSVGTLVITLQMWS